MAASFIILGLILLFVYLGAMLLLEYARHRAITALRYETEARRAALEEALRRVREEGSRKEKETRQ